MRKFVKVVGVGEKRVSKKGWHYLPLSFLYEDYRVKGEKAVTVNVGVDALGEYKDFPFAPGNEVDCYMHESNFNIFVDDVVAVR